MDQLREECCQCSKCGLYLTRTNVVFGKGAQDAQIMLVGEGPGYHEDISGEPFVGAAGQLLDDMLSIIDLDVSNCYITNVVKCRPPMNRDPLPGEQEACIPWLRQQTATLRPQIIVCLGRIAARRLIRPDFTITRDHGAWTRKGNIWMTAIYHPAALLRDLEKRPDTYRDLQKIQEKAWEICPEIFDAPL